MRMEMSKSTEMGRRKKNQLIKGVVPEQSSTCSKKSIVGLRAKRWLKSVFGLLYPNEAPSL